jgi:SpoIID/LytB domain protein
MKDHRARSRRGPLIGLFVAALLLTGLAFAPAARAAAGDFVFTGRGWGHGVGMSQWGAWQAAKEGVTFDKIVAFYYPGTTLEPLDDTDAEVRVRISSEPWTSNTINFVQVDLKPAVTAMMLLKHTSSGDDTQVIPVGSFINVLYSAGKVQVVTEEGAQGPFDYIEVRPVRTGDDPAEGRIAIQLKTSGKTLSYRGAMRVQPGDDAGELWVYNTLPIEKYLRSIAEVDYDWAVPGSAAYAPEAVKAQTVAARTYALAKNGPLADNQYDQCYVGYTGRSKPGATPFEALYPGIPASAEETAGLILRYQGKPIKAQFSAHSGGYTTNSAWSGITEAYLAAQPDPWSLEAPPASMSSAGPGYNWTYTISAADLSAEFDVGMISRVEIVARDTADPESHVKTLRLIGDKGTTTVAATTLKSRLGLRSTLILSVTGGEPLGPGEFYDVGGSHIYHDQIARVVTAGLMSGYGSGLFGPGKTVTRWQFAKVAVNLYNIMHPSDQIAVVNVTAAPFGDVPAIPEETGDVSDWVAAAKKAGLVSGVTSTSFQPNAVVRRDQMATMLCRALGWEDKAADLPADAPGFADVPPGSTHWAAAAYLKQQGIIQGYLDPSGGSATLLRIDEPIKRQHVAVILCRVLDLVQ